MIELVTLNTAMHLSGVLEHHENPRYQVRSLIPNGGRGVEVRLSAGVRQRGHLVCRRRPSVG